MPRGSWDGLIIARQLLLNDSQEDLRKSVLDWVLSRIGCN